jgi:hypothetical protein
MIKPFPKVFRIKMQAMRAVVHNHRHRNGYLYSASREPKGPKGLRQGEKEGKIET